MTDQRHGNIPQLLDLYSRDNLVTGFIILDNRRDSALFDQALAHCIVSLVSAPWMQDQRHTLLNNFADLFLHHEVATLRTWVGMLGVHYEPAVLSLPAFFHSDMGFAQSQAITGIREVLGVDPRLQSLPLATASHPRLVCATAPIRPEPEFRRLAERVRMSGVPGLTHDTTLGFASIGYPMRPDSQEAPLVVAGLVPILGGIPAVKRYVGDIEAQGRPPVTVEENSEPNPALASQFGETLLIQPGISQSRGRTPAVDGHER